MSNYLKLVPKPSPASINSGLSALNTSQLIARLGHPRAARDYTQSCQPVANQALKRHIITANVGPFRVTGYDLAVQQLTLVFNDVRLADPALYALLGSAGMLCCRLVRGSRSVLSNHAFGLAVDLTLGGVLDTRGDNLVQQGLLDLYPHFHRHGFYWGAEYPTEDAMHFELSQEKFQELSRAA
ncbi:MAG TPA: M15 family metallopeptidase [Armatimonadota bacterium]|jgi:hypothetical protein